MRPCDTCGNTYDKAFEVVVHDQHYFFDCIECAAHLVAPRCTHCSCTILGHGVEAGNRIFCCAHCARQEGTTTLQDRAMGLIIP